MAGSTGHHCFSVTRSAPPFCLNPVLYHITPNGILLAEASEEAMSVCRLVSLRPNEFLIYLTSLNCAHPHQVHLYFLRNLLFGKLLSQQILGFLLHVAKYRQGI